eukprot:3026240-Alexandrium_andersonii.AAC.1
MAPGHIRQKLLEVPEVLRALPQSFYLSLEGLRIPRTPTHKGSFPSPPGDRFGNLFNLPSYRYQRPMIAVAVQIMQNASTR